MNESTNGAGASPPPAGFTPKGTQEELRKIACWVNPLAAESDIQQTMARLNGIAIYFLVEQHNAATPGSIVTEKQRYQRIVDAAEELRLALDNAHIPGLMSGPLGQLRSQFETKKPDEMPSNIEIAYGICWRWGQRAHPLYFIEQVARQALDKLMQVSGRSPGTLHQRLRHSPKTALAIACGRLLLDTRNDHLILGGRLAVSDSGALATLAKKVWTFAVGTESPPMGDHIKKAAAALRDEARPPV